MKFIFTFITILLLSSSFAQEAYNACNSALEICPNTVVSVNNIGANKTFCPNCEDDFNFCYTPENTIWLTFTSNDLGGALQVSINNVSFQTEAGRDIRFNASLIEATTPCISSGFTEVGNCIGQQTTNQTINVVSTLPNTTYYLVLSGERSGAGITLPAEFSADVSISGAAIDRPVPYINLGMDLAICANALTPVYSSRVNCEDPGDYLWYVNDVHVATTTDSVYFSSDFQEGDVVTVTSTCFTSCPTTITQTLPAVSIIPIICDAGEDVTIGPNEVTLLQGSASINSLVTWTPSYALSETDILNPVAGPSVTTTYTLLVLDTITGCEMADYVTVTVDNGLFVPTTFSPNGDGENDTWVILGIQNYPDCILNIYNRWGQHIFQSTGYNLEKAWDGTGKSGKLNEGVYFFELQLRDPEDQILKGSITLIR